MYYFGRSREQLLTDDVLMYVHVVERQTRQRNERTYVRTIRQSHIVKQKNPLRNISLLLLCFVVVVALKQLDTSACYKTSTKQKKKKKKKEHKLCMCACMCVCISLCLCIVPTALY